MKKIEEKIIRQFSELMNSNNIGKNHKVYKLSTRDKIACVGVCVVYALHDFNLFVYDCIENAFYFLSTTEGSQFDSCMSATTKNRLNAFLLHFANTSIHQKDYENFFKNGEKVEVNAKYRISNGTILKM